MRSVLWISLVTPYAKIKHAGGQNLCNMFKYIKESHLFNIRSVAFYEPSEVSDIKDSGLCETKDLIEYKCNTFYSLIDFENRVNIFNRNGGYLKNSKEILLKNRLRKLLNEGYKPEVIILHWTEIVMMINTIKKMFPEAKIIAIEEDVAYLRRKRRVDLQNNKISRLIHYHRFLHSKKRELMCLKESDLIITNNVKDKELLVRDGIINPILDMCVYFEPKFNLTHVGGKDVVFWGAMNRKENYEAVLWFIRNVMPVFQDTDLRFVIVGANPPECIMKEKNEKIIVTGYVDSPDEFFQNCLCVVVPLQLGAGIKVKVLEAMSAGTPIIANSIGIEGIPAKDGIEYIHAESSQEFATAIKKYQNMSKKEIEDISDNERQLIRAYFCFEDKMKEVTKEINSV